MGIKLYFKYFLFAKKSQIYNESLNNNAIINIMKLTLNLTVLYCNVNTRLFLHYLLYVPILTTKHNNILRIFLRKTLNICVFLKGSSKHFDPDKNIRYSFILVRTFKHFSCHCSFKQVKRLDFVFTRASKGFLCDRVCVE